MSRSELCMDHTDLENSDFNRLRVFFASKLNKPLVCLSTARVFSTVEMDVVRSSLTTFHAEDRWQFEAHGAIILQLKYDPELPKEVCGAQILISNPKTCDIHWSKKLYSWYTFRNVDEHFIMLIPSADGCMTPSGGSSGKTYDRAIGVYFANSSATKQFHDFLTQYKEGAVVYDKRDHALRKEAIKKYKAAKRAQRKTDPIRKSIISAPVMFCHTAHMTK